MPAQQAQSVEVPKRWPLVTQIGSRSIVTNLQLPQKDPRLINCYAEYDANIEGYQVQKRFGTLLSGTGPVVPGYLNGLGHTNWSPTGAFNLNAPSYAIWGRPDPFFGTGTATLTINGTVLGSVGQLPYPTFNGSFDFAATQSNNSVLAFLNGAGGFYTSVFSGPVQMPIPGPAPGSAYCGLVYMDGVLYAMDTSCNIYGSNTDDPTTWDPLNVILANALPGSGVTLIRHRSYLVALKNTSMEVFATNPNAPVPGSALQPVKEGLSHLGCANRESVRSIDDINIWITVDITQANTPQVVMLENLGTAIISTPPVDRLLVGAMTDTMRSFTFRKDGHRFYALTLITNNITLVFDIDQRLWYIWCDAAGNALPYSDASFDANGNIILEHSSNGQEYFLNSASVYANDSGELFPVDIYTPNYDAGTRRGKMLNAMYFSADQVKSFLFARYNDNDFDAQKWSNFRRIDLSQSTPTIFDEGTFRKRAYHFRHMANTDFRIRYVDLQMGLCTL